MTSPSSPPSSNEPDAPATDAEAADPTNVDTPGVEANTHGHGPVSGDRTKPTYGLSRAVFGVAAAVVILAVLLAVFLPTVFNNIVGTINTKIVEATGWYYVLVVTFFVFASIVIAMTRLGSIKLGRDDEKPEYSTFSWFAMLFAAGMGIGLVFWGAAEPLTFFEGGGAPRFADLPDAERAVEAMSQVLLHWGVHAWGTYVVVGLALAYSVHRRGRPLSVRWALEPILGKRTDTWIGDLVDILAIVGTVFGVSMSLGFGVNQITAGLEHMNILTATPTTKIVLVFVITALATASVVSGVDRGIKYLSNTNLALAAVFLLLVAGLGPTVFLLRDFVDNIGGYISTFLSNSFQTMPFFGQAGAEWLNGWTINYWGWWISWSPFVGVFIARISRGRTVREFIVGVLLVPTLVTILWFTVMGGTAIYKTMFEGLSFTQPDGSVDTNTALFDVLSTMPMSGVLVGITIILLTIFFITSADSGAFVMDIIAHKGDPNPPRLTRVFWAVSSGLIAAALIGAGAATGTDDTGMTALQALALIAALPWSVVMVAMIFATVKSLRHEVRRIERIELNLRRQAIVNQVTDRVHDQVTDEVTEAVLDRVSTATGELDLLAIQTGGKRSLSNEDSSIKDSRDRRR